MKLTKVKQIIIIMLLTWVNFAAIALQDEEAPIDQAAAETKTESQKSANVTSESSNSTSQKAPSPNKVDIPIPTPKSLTLQHKEDLKHYLPADKVQPLLAGPDDYITLVTKNTSVNNKGVAILLPDWQQGVTNPKGLNFLRKQLPLQGWTTISIQPTSKPVNYPSTALEVSEQQQENKAIIDNYENKLSTMMNAVIAKANEHPGIVIIIAQGNHGAMLINLLHQGTEQPKIAQPPNALILLSSYVLTSNELLNEVNTAFAQKVASSEYPVLDLYLRNDNPIVLDKAQQRLSLSKKEMKVYYRQRQLINGAMGYYPEQELLTQINSWLRSMGW